MLVQRSHFLQVELNSVVTLINCQLGGQHGTETGESNDKPVRNEPTVAAWLLFKRTDTTRTVLIVRTQSAADLRIIHPVSYVRAVCVASSTFTFNGYQIYSSDVL